MWILARAVLSTLVGTLLMGQEPDVEADPDAEARTAELRAIAEAVAQAKVDGVADTGQHAEAVASRLLHRDGRVRAAAVRSLLEIDPDLEDLHYVLVRIIAVPPEQYSVCGGSGEVFPDAARYLFKLRSADPTVRANAVQVVCRGMAGDINVLPRVLRMLNDRHPDVRSEVARWIATLGWRDAVREGLAKALTDDHAKVRQAAAEGLRGRDEGAVVDLLTSVLHDPDEGVRAEAVTSIGRAQRHGAHAASDLLGMLKDRQESVRIATLAALGRLNLSSHLVKERVRSALADGAPPEQLQAIRTLESIASPRDGSVWAVLGCGSHEASDVRYQALKTAWALASFEQRGAVVLKAIGALREEPHRVAAERLLRQWVHSPR